MKRASDQWAKTAIEGLAEEVERLDRARESVEADLAATVLNHEARLIALEGAPPIQPRPPAELPDWRDVMWPTRQLMWRDDPSLYHLEAGWDAADPRGTDYRETVDGEPVRWFRTTSGNNDAKLLQWGETDGPGPYIFSADFFWRSDSYPDSSWHNIMQTKGREKPWDPCWFVDIRRDGEITLNGYWLGAPSLGSGVVMPRQQWFSLTWYYRTDRANGSMELWLDGERIMDASSVPTAQPGILGVMWGVGHYGLWVPNDELGLYVRNIEVHRT